MPLYIIGTLEGVRHVLRRRRDDADVLMDVNPTKPQRSPEHSINVHSI